MRLAHYSDAQRVEDRLYIQHRPLRGADITLKAGMDFSKAGGVRSNAAFYNGMYCHPISSLQSTGNSLPLKGFRFNASSHGGVKVFL